MLQNPRVTAFTASELIRENLKGGIIIPPSRLGLKSDSHLPKNCFICFNESLLRVMKNVFLKSSFCSQDIQVFMSWLFGHVEKMAWLER